MIGACLLAAYSAADAMRLLYDIRVEGVFTIETAGKEVVNAWLHTGDVFSTAMDTDAMPSTGTRSLSAPVVHSSPPPQAQLLSPATGGADSTSTAGFALSQDTTTPLGDDGDLLADEILEDPFVDIVSDI